MTSTVAERWARARSFHHSAFPAARIAAARTDTVSVCLPARECAHTIGEIVAVCCALRDDGLLDEIVVVDAASADGTAAVAERAGATVLQESELCPEYGPVLGKGDAMWRALGELRGDVVCFLDADIVDFRAHYVSGILGPIVCEPAVSFVKAFYRRPFRHAGVSIPDGGGRVNHLMARPALAMFYPELAGVRQPLAGEMAARRELLHRIPWTTGYGVETAMLIDVWREVGLDEMAQVDLDSHQNANQSVHALSSMAYTVLEVIAGRLEREGRLRGFDPAPLLGADGPQSVALAERPPLASLRAAAGSAPASRARS